MFQRIAAVLIALAALPAFSQEEWKEQNVEGAKESRFLKFYPQSKVTEFNVMEFDGVEMIVAYDRKKAEATTANLEGKVTKYSSLHKPGTSALEIVRNYEAALKKAGFTTLFASKGGDAAPGLPINFDQTMGTFRLDANGKPVAYVNVVGGGDAARPDSAVTIIEIKAMEQKLEANADAWFDEISKAGRVAVYGINFDTGKATITADSAKVLEEIRKLAAGHPELKLRIEGHTDNVGAATANRKLSEDRANAVKTWLVAKGVKAPQLATAGLGDSKPVADNTSDDGRAKNRRVELVRL